jgi:hypothetical protein
MASYVVLERCWLSGFSAGTGARALELAGGLTLFVTAHPVRRFPPENPVDAKE